MEAFGLDNLKATCGGKDFSSTFEYMNQISADYKELAKMSNSIVDLVVCERINPIYVDLVFDTTCAETTPLLVLALSLILVSSFFGLILITFRSSWLDVLRTDRLEDYEFPITPLNADDSLRNVELGDYEESFIPSNQEERGDPSGLGRNESSPARSNQSNYSSNTSPSSLEKMSVAADDDALKIIPPSSPGKDPSFKVY